MSCHQRPTTSATVSPRAWWKYACRRVIEEEVVSGHYKASSVVQQKEEGERVCNTVVGNNQDEETIITEDNGAVVDSQAAPSQLNPFALNQPDSVSLVREDPETDNSEVKGYVSTGVNEGSSDLNPFAVIHQDVIATEEIQGEELLCEKRETESESSAEDLNPFRECTEDKDGDDKESDAGSISDNDSVLSDDCLNPFGQDTEKQNSFEDDDSSEGVAVVIAPSPSSNPFDSPSVVYSSPFPSPSPSASSSTNPFDMMATASSSTSSSSTSSSSNPFGDSRASESRSSSRRMPSPSMQSSQHNLCQPPRTARKTMPLPSPGSSAPVQTTATVASRPMPPLPKAQSCSSLMSSSSTSSSSPLASSVAAPSQVVARSVDEVQLIKMGFDRKEVERVCLNNNFEAALSSLSNDILEHISLQKSVKHLFQPPLETRVGSWMPTQSGSSNHIVFYIKVTVHGSKGFSYHLEKTYKQFLKLKKKLSTPIFDIIPEGLAHKFEDNRSFFKNDTEEILDERREMLHKWLRGICRLPELMISESIHSLIFDFLSYNDNVDVSVLL